MRKNLGVFFVVLSCVSFLVYAEHKQEMIDVSDWTHNKPYVEAFSIKVNVDTDGTIGQLKGEIEKQIKDRKLPASRQKFLYRGEPVGDGETFKKYLKELSSGDFSLSEVEIHVKK